MAATCDFLSDALAVRGSARHLPDTAVLKGQGLS
jgi:hypothetical protein